MLDIIRKRRAFAKGVLWFIVGMLAVGLIFTGAAWYFQPGQSVKTPAQVSGKEDSSGKKEDGASAELKQLQDLLKQYEGMAQARPDDPAVLTGYARISSELGNYYIRQGDSNKGKEFYGRAVASYEKVLSQRDDQNVRLELALVYQELGSFDQAEVQLKKILEKDPNSLQANIQLGLLFEASGDQERAAQFWKVLTENRNLAPEVRSFAEERLEKLQGKKQK